MTGHDPERRHSPHRCASHRQPLIRHQPRLVKRIAQPGKFGKATVQNLPELPQSHLFITRKTCTVIGRIRHHYPKTGLRQRHRKVAVHQLR